MPLYENNNTLHQLARIGGLKLLPEQKQAVAAYVQETFPDYPSKNTLEAMLECATLGEMLHYFRESKRNGAGKTDTHQMAKALLHAETLLNIAPAVTIILGSYRGSRLENIPSR